MPNKLKKNTKPIGHEFTNFKCFGPTAEKDNQFAGTKMTDLGCFQQGKSDNNKYYFASICQSTVNQGWYVYTEYGRTGERVGGYQFHECINENEAEKLYIKLCESKNIKRGRWVSHPTLGQILEPKPNKDLYLVRQLSSRNVQLTDANSIGNVGTVQVVNTGGDNLDIQTQKLFTDLGAGTTEYTRNATVGNIIPAQVAIDETRLLLDECTKITNNIAEVDYLQNKELHQLSSMIYQRIPKKKRLNSNAWIVTPDQNLLWQNDLDSFESALSAGTYESNTTLSALNLLKFKWVDPNNPLGGWIYKWWPTATANKHSYLGNLTVKNVWYLERIGDTEKLNKYQKSIGKVNNQYKPLFQPQRKDKIDHNLYKNSATYTLFHGTRSVNVAPIIKESLRLPKELSRSSITGNLFGNSTYWASDVKKSVGYTSYKGGYWSKGSGSIPKRGAFMFVADVVLGKMYRCRYGHTTGPPSGHHSVYAQAGYSGVQNDEHMVFNTNGFKLRYLVEFE